MGATTKKGWTRHEAHAFLARGRWLGSLSEEMQIEILASGQIATVEAGDTLFKVGDAVDGLYATLDGDVRAYTYDDEGEPIFLRPLGPGSWFGDVHLLDAYPKRTFEVRCASTANFFRLPSAAFYQLIEDQQYYRAFVRLVCSHLKHAVRILVESRSDAPKRTARALVRLARAHGIGDDKEVRLAMNLSQADLASLVGVSRQHMNELIARWEDEGYLRWNGKSRPLLNLVRLRSLLGPLDRWIEDSEDWV